jgi:hypothetical protein
MSVKKNEIGEQLVLCELSGQWENVTLAECFGNCEGQELTPDYVANRLEQLACSAYSWHINDKVVGIPVTEFEQLMTIAAKMILR